jgi:hypothetical protein
LNKAIFGRKAPRLGFVFDGTVEIEFVCAVFFEKTSKKTVVVTDKKLVFEFEDSWIAFLLGFKLRFAVYANEVNSACWEFFVSTTQLKGGFSNIKGSDTMTNVDDMGSRECLKKLSFDSSDVVVVVAVVCSERNDLHS